MTDISTPWFEFHSESDAGSALEGSAISTPFFEMEIEPELEAG
jgi:hypothetical protein